MEQPSRLRSLDALRGFDMFWIIGGAELIGALAPLLDMGWLNWLDAQTGTHVEWEGFVFWDLVFPLFLFISGVTLPFSLGKTSWDRGALVKKAVRRGLTLVLLGFVYNGILAFDWADMRYPSVLGRIGLAWMGAALIWICCGMRGRILWLLGLLLGYWAAMLYIPVPGHGAGDLSMEGNLASWIDRSLLPGRLYKGIHDPEGLASTLPAVGTALLGAFTGSWLRTERHDAWKFLGLAGAAAALIALGHYWSQVFPLNKNLWTSSFVVWCAGWSLALLAVFYLLIDVLGFWHWSFPFMVIGFNPITIYLVQRQLVDFGLPVDFLAGGMLGLLPEQAAELTRTFLVLLTKWGLLWFLFRQRIFLRV